MAHDYAQAFYTSIAWIKCRTAYMQSQYYICERCGDVATICHHKEYITPDNINDPYVTLNWDNLEACCQTCHTREHHSADTTADGLAFDADGNLIKK